MGSTRTTVFFQRGHSSAVGVYLLYLKVCKTQPKLSCSYPAYIGQKVVLMRSYTVACCWAEFQREPIGSPATDQAWLWWLLTWHFSLTMSLPKLLEIKKLLWLSDFISKWESELDTPLSSEKKLEANYQLVVSDSISNFPKHFSLQHCKNSFIFWLKLTLSWNTTSDKGRRQKIIYTNIWGNFQIMEKPQFQFGNFWNKRGLNFLKMSEF